MSWRLAEMIVRYRWTTSVAVVTACACVLSLMVNGSHG